MRCLILLLIAAPLSACLMPTPDNVGYEVNGSRVRWVNVTMGSVLMNVQRVNIPQADAATFRALDHYYAVDARHAYCRAQVLPDTDPATFKTLPGGFAIGSRNVHLAEPYGCRILEGANPATWRRIEGTQYSTDGAGVWYASAPLEGVDATTFRVRPGHPITPWKSSGRVSRDARNFYEANTRVGSVDDCSWLNDADRYIHYGRETLDYLCNELAKDIAAPDAE